MVGCPVSELWTSISGELMKSSGAPAIGGSYFVKRIEQGNRKSRNIGLSGCFKHLTPNEHDFQ
jgi:hypothetical protein